MTTKPRVAGGFVVCAVVCSGYLSVSGIGAIRAGACRHFVGACGRRRRRVGSQVWPTVVVVSLLMVPPPEGGRRCGADCTTLVRTLAPRLAPSLALSFARNVVRVADRQGHPRLGQREQQLHPLGRGDHLAVGQLVAHPVQELTSRPAARPVTSATVPADTGVPNSTASAWAVRFWEELGRGTGTR